MYNDRISLSTQDILDKEFKVDARGYRPQEVDKFLDIVIRDYTEYNSILRKYEKDVKDLMEENSKLKQEVLVLNEKLEVSKSSENLNNNRTLTNVDLLKRISQLEKVVFGKEE